tara:strand:- start:250 stop:840 length:591 start_codon:yes stop_codon:yes gene_type:complete
MIVILIGYLIGSIQPAFFIGKLKGIDIRDHGSKNAGAANTTMTLGWALGISTGCIDVLKATFTVYLILNLYPTPTVYPVLPFLGGVMAVIGHNYPFYMNFNGGKGTASAIGIILGYDFYMGLVMVAVIIISTVITNYLVVGTVNIYLVMIYLAIFKYQSTEIMCLSILLGVLGVYKHRMNFVRIKNGTEPTFRGTL